MLRAGAFKATHRSSMALGSNGGVRVDSASQRLDRAVEAPDPAAAVPELARALRDEVMPQRAMYRLFADQQERLPRDDPRYDAVVDTMDLIWGGLWAKGRALFDTELTDAKAKDE
jgi:hypothetical protein